MRVGWAGAATLVFPNECGNLEVSGPVLFKRYYNNASVIHDVFEADGLF